MKEFTPWKHGRIRVPANGTTMPYENRIIRSSDEHWKEPLNWNDAATFLRDMPPVDCRPIVRVTIDPFIEYDGRPIVDETGSILYQCDCGCVGIWNDCCPKCQDSNNMSQKLLTITDLFRDLMKLIDSTPNLDWLIETRHPELIRGMIPVEGRMKRHNLILAAIVSTHPEVETRIPKLLECRDLCKLTAIRAIPKEELNLRRLNVGDCPKMNCFDGSSDLQGYRFDIGDGISWLICNGDSDPIHPDWIRSLRDQATGAGIAFRFDGWGDWLLTEMPKLDRATRAILAKDGFENADSFEKVGKEHSGCLLDGKEWKEFPK